MLPGNYCRRGNQRGALKKALDYPEKYQTLLAKYAQFYNNAVFTLQSIWRQLATWKMKGKYVILFCKGSWQWVSKCTLYNDIVVQIDDFLMLMDK